MALISSMISIVKKTLLSIPIWVGLTLALLFPYYGLNVSHFGFTALFLLSLINTFTFNFKLSVARAHDWKRVAFHLLVGYTLFPSIQLLLAKFLVHDPSLQLGFLLSSIAPVAIVIPQFLRQRSDIDSAIVYILISTLLFPVFCYLYLTAMGFDRFGIHIVPLIKDAVLLTFAPVLISYQVELLAGDIKEKITRIISPFTPFVNMSLIGFLVFIYFGSAFSKTNLSEIDFGLWLTLATLALAQDFLALFLQKFFRFPLTEQLCFSIKNVALSGGVLLVFHPQGILACSAVLVAHSLYFTLLSIPETYQRLLKKPA